MCAKPFSAVLFVSALFEKTVGDPDPPSRATDDVKLLYSAVSMRNEPPPLVEIWQAKRRTVYVYYGS